MIPKIVYVFWDGTMDTYTTACLRNIQKMNPAFKVVVLSSETTEDKPDNYDALFVQAKSDWARVDAVCKTGGVWIDISCIVLKPFEAWIDFDSDAFHGFEVPFDCDLVENWAFAAPKGCPVLLQWRWQFKKAIEDGFEKYNRNNEIPPCLEKWLPYLTNHQALHVAWKSVPNQEVRIVDSTSKDMPYHLISVCEWNNSRFVELLRREKHLTSVFLKVNGQMKKELEWKGVREMTAEEVSDIDRYSHVERLLKIRIGEGGQARLTFLVVSICVLIVILLVTRMTDGHPC